MRQCLALLLGDGTDVGLLQRAAKWLFKHQRGHQVLEHRTRPRAQRSQVAVAEKGPAKRTPVLHRHVAFGNGNQAGQTRLAGQQVVVVAVELLAVDLKTNVHQTASLVIQRFEVHRASQLARAPSQVVKAHTRRLNTFHGVAQVRLQGGHQVLQHPQRTVGHAAVAAQRECVQLAPGLVHDGLQPQRIVAVGGPDRLALEELRDGAQRVDGAEQRAQAVRPLACAAQHLRGVSQRHGVQRKLFAGLRHDEQKRRQVAAIDGGDVGRRQHRAGAGVEPVVKMAQVFGQPLQRVQCCAQAISQVERTDEVKFARAGGRQ